MLKVNTGNTDTATMLEVTIQDCNSFNSIQRVNSQHHRHLVISSSGHLVISSSRHLVISSSRHLVISPSGHLVGVG